MSDTKELTISKELYNKYRDKQKESHNLLIELGKQYYESIAVESQTKDKASQMIQKHKINNLKENIVIHTARSRLLRELLLEIALENKEDKANEN